MGRSGNTVQRISISLPGSVLERLDQMVVARGFGSRSQAVIDTIMRAIGEWGGKRGDEVRAGTITLVYDRAVPGVQARLAELQQHHIDEVISSLHVQLEHAHTMEVVLVQGPARILRAIADAMITERGVLSGQLQLTASIMPPLHPLGMRTSPRLNAPDSTGSRTLDEEKIQ